MTSRIAATGRVGRGISAAESTQSGGFWSLRNPFFTGNRTQIIVLAARYGWPAIHQWREFADAGGQASYGPSFFDSYRQAGLFAARILKW